MKKSVLALSVISALFLAGCSSDDDNEVVTPEPVEKSRDVTVEVSSIYGELSTTPMSTYSEDGTGSIAECKLAISKTSPSEDSASVPFDLQYCNDGYTLTIEHDGETITRTGISLTEKVTAGNVTGAVTFTLTHPELESIEDSYYYTLSGSATVDASEVDVKLIATNENWSLVTVSNNSDISEARLNTISMISHDSMSRNTITRTDFIMYTKESESFLEVESKKHSSYGSTYVETQTNKHHHLPLVINEDGSVIINPGFGGDPIKVTPASPVMEDSALLVNGLSNYTVDSLSGAVTYTIDAPNARDVEPYSYTQISIADSKNTIADYSIEFDALTTRLDETTAFPTLSIYVTDNPGSGNNGDLKQNTNLKFYGVRNESGNMLVRAYKHDGIQWNGKVDDNNSPLYEPISEYNTWHVSSTWGEDATQGNFYIRYNDDSENTGATVVITEHEFSLKSETE
ncbi:hypothetical protein [Shewanella goraebulensis]|uniref:hypothetical protein n=1 Tax=Shewanella goraebulensis TaxID=3050637 RepID=UPI00254E432C|nr:hypothetical protein [Shewanella goraebulensis]